MVKTLLRVAVEFVLVLSLSLCYSEQRQASQTQTLLIIQSLLNFPHFLNSWNNHTNLCSIDQISSVTVACYEDRVTQLHIIGSGKNSRLPSNFSIDSLFTIIAKLPVLKVLTLVSLGLWGPFPGVIGRLSSLEILNVSSNFLVGPIPEEISSLTNLQTLILDDNMFVDRLPQGLSSLYLLSVLSVRNNSLNGTLTESLGSLTNLRVLVLSHNNFSGEVPDISSLTNLEVLDLEDNSLGPQFPQVCNKIITLVLKKNKFTSNMPDTLISYHRLQHLDASLNNFIGPFRPFIFSLPSLTYLNIEGNKFTGMLSENISCNPGLDFVDLSSNLLTGKLPSCLVTDSEKRELFYSGNCLHMEDGDQIQHPLSFCQNEASAVGIVPHHHKVKETSGVMLSLSITGGIIGVVVILSFGFLMFERIRARRLVKAPALRFIAENASAAYPSKLLLDSRYATQAMKRGALGLPAYRTFSLEELEEATNRFDTSTFMGEGSRGQMYRGRLRDGSFIAVWCLKIKRRRGIQSVMQHIELISKLRHQHLVSALGHCFECYFDDSSISRIFLVFEYMSNGTLKDWISGKCGRRSLSWSQCIAAATGVARGIQFLHTGIVPGIFQNNLEITDVLLDHNLVSKISSYNLPLLADDIEKPGVQSSSSACRESGITRVMHQGKLDIYDFGVILLQIIVGRPLNTRAEIETIKYQLQATMAYDEAALTSAVDPVVHNVCSEQSLRTVMEMCCRSLAKNPAERPSTEDILWNLQFAAQVQDAWQSSEGSPISSVMPTQHPIVLQN